MRNFVVIYHAPATFMEQAKDASPEEMQKGMEQWMEWAAKCGDGLVDLGTPLSGGQKLSKSGSCFHRGRNAAAYEGSGLGLAIVKAIVEGHGGQVSAESTHQGACFSVQLACA